MASSIEFNCPKYYDFTAPTPLPKKRQADCVESAAKRQKCSPTLAEKIYQFEHGIRLHSADVSKTAEKPSLTQPKPFALLTSERAELRPPPKKPDEEYIPLSVQIARWMNDTPPRLKRDVVPCLTRPPERTIPQPFHLFTSTRAVHHKQPVMDEPQVPNFRATPVNPKMFESQLGIKKVDKKPNTACKEFRMSKREAVRSSARQHAEKQPDFQFKATPMPSGTPFRPVLPHRVVTTTPFQLATENRPQQKPAQRSETEGCHAFVFKAQPWNAETFARPFPTRRYQKPLTQTHAFKFHSDQRASVRAIWEDERRQKELARKEALAQREKERQEHEAEDLKAYRKALVHHPLPIGIKKRPAPTFKRKPSPTRDSVGSPLNAMR